MKANSKLLRQPTIPRPGWPVKLWSLLLNLAIYALLFGVLAYRQRIAFHVLRTRESSLFGSLWRLATAVILIFLLTTAVHELGHLLAGKLVGLRLHLLIIGPLRVVRENGRLRVSLQKSVAIFNGMTKSLPEDARNLPHRLLAYTLGGPLASLLQAVLAAALFVRWAADVHFTNNNAWVVESAAITAVYAAIIFLSAIKPTRYQSELPADGGRIISLLYASPEAARWCALVALSGADVRGQRPRDWDESLIQQALTGYDHTHDGQLARFLTYFWALDNGRIAEANRWLEEAIAIHPTRLANIPIHLLWEKAYFAARHLNDPVQARGLLTHVRSKEREQPGHLRADA
ncbi:MAG: hypothetical protein P8183_09380, partial [Anaerolineae bacterium]